MSSRDPGLKDYFRSEIATLSSLSHPGVVGFIEQGLIADEPWYAMDLLQGSTLRKHVPHRMDVGAGARSAVANPPTPTRPVGARDVVLPAPELPPAPAPPPLSREQLVAVCTKVLEALEYVHGQGIVHGDLKPENIFLRADLSPVLVDFGVAAPFSRGRERLVRVPRSIGSVAYMAPECLHGSLPDARSDLYAMGCVLYECLTGRHPLLRDTAHGTALAHLHAMVLPPSHHDASVPRRWDTLVLRLLAKTPEDRPGFARDAMLALGAPGTHPQAAETTGAIRHYLYRAPLVGRAAAVAHLRARLSQTDLGDAKGQLLLRGGRGMGKTRLAMELSQDALRQGSLVFRIECLPPSQSEGGPPFAAMRSLVRALRDQDAEAPVAEITNALGACEVALETLARASRDGQTGVGGGAPFEAAVSGLSEAVATTAGRRTTLLLVDDLEHADELTRDVVRRLATDVRPEQRLMIACTTSQMAPDAEDAKLTGTFEVVGLDPLTEADVDVAVRSMLALEHPSPTLLERAHEVSQGNPFILGLYLRALIDSGVLRRDRTRGWHLEWPADAAPSGAGALAPRIESVASLFEWRVNDLPESERRIAEIAAVIGPAIEARRLAAVAGRSEADTRTALEALCRRQVLEAQGTAGYRFCHPLLAERLVSRLDPEQAKRIHRRTAAVLCLPEHRGSAGSAALAVHLRACGCHARAARCFIAAGHAYVQGYRRREGLDMLEAAARELDRLSAPEETRARDLLDLHETIGDVALSLRRHGRAIAAYQAALGFVRDDQVRSARQYRKLASAMPLQPAAIDYLERAIALLAGVAGTDGDWRCEWIQTHLDAMWIHYWKQRTGDLLALAARIESSVRDWGTETQRAEFDFNMAVGLMQRNRYVTGPTELAHVERALDGYARVGDRAKVSMCRFLRSMILLFAGELHAAEAGFEAVLAVSEKSTSVTIRVRALTFLCILHRKRRDRERVRRLATAALSLATEHNMPEYRATATANLGWVALQDGAPEECERLVRDAIAVWNASPLNVFRWTGLLPLLAALAARAEPALASTDVAQIAAGLLDESQQALPAPLVEALQALGRAADRSPDEVRALADKTLALAASCGLV